MRISDWSSDVCSSDLLSHGYYDAYYLQAQRVRRMIVNDFQQAFSNQCDVIMGPVTPSVAKQIGDNREDPTSDWLAAIYNLGVSLAGLPRSEERRVGQEGVRTGRSRWQPYPKKKTRKNNTQ